MPRKTTRKNAAPFLVSVTYDTVTPESAEQGEADDRGLERERAYYTLRETLQLLRQYGPFDSAEVRRASERYARGSLGHATFYGSGEDVDYSTGAVTTYAVHVDASARDIDRLIRASKVRTNPPLSPAQRGKRSRAKMARTVAKHGLLSPEAVALRQRMDARAKRRRRGRTVLRRQAKRSRRRTLSNPTTITVKLSRIGGFVDQIRYQDVNDRKYYKHDGEDANTIMYLAEHHSFGRCLMIVNADAKPLWEDA